MAAPHRSGAARLLVAGLLLAAAGCASVRPREAVPEALVAQAHIAGIDDARAWGDEPDARFTADMVNSVRQELAWYRSHPELTMPPTLDILAISGGGENGALAAGLLCGWSEGGTRPQFKLVTGISTGALIAPLAFLGPRYDHVLRESYTKVSGEDIFKKRGLLSIFTEDSVLDSRPLRRMVEKLVTEDVLKAVATEHRHGRRLLIGTTDLDAQRPVLWDMGAIAASGDPRALQLFRDVMIASASIPGAFPPVYVDVEAGGKTYSEMHVDGGTYAQVFLWGPGLSREVGRQALGPDYQDRPARLFVIRNSRVSPEWAAVAPRVLPIGLRAISTLIKANGLNDLYRLYQLAQQNRMEYHLAYIPDDLRDWPTEPFDTTYMGKLFDLAFAQAKAGYSWHETPPLVSRPATKQDP